MSSRVHYAMADLATLDIGDHVFPVEKYAILRELLEKELGVGPERFHPARAVDRADLERVHMPRYVEDLLSARRAWSTQRSEMPIDEGIIDGFLRMTGGSLRAVELAMMHGVGFHVGGGFHHAFPDHAEGFCYIHDVAVAVEWWRAREGVDRVLFVDVDVHQGNGTAVIYAGDRETFTYSIHQERNYPLKQQSDLDRGLDDGIGDDAYLRILEKDLDRVAERFEPDLVCVLAGVDPHREDVLGGLGLSDEGLRRRDEQVLGRYLGEGIPVAVFLAGGYAPTPRRTAELHLQTARSAERCAARLRADHRPS